MEKINKRGKPAQIEYNQLEEVVLSEKNKIVIKGQIAPMSDPIWVQISQKLGNCVKPTTLHSYIVGNRYKFREKIFGHVERSCRSDSDDAEDGQSDPSFEDMSLDLHGAKHLFTITLTKTEFQGLIMERLYRSSTKEKTKERCNTILNPKIWTEFIAKKIYDEAHLNHAYQFTNHHITKDERAGKINGKCKCGSQLKIKIQANELEPIVKFKCITSQGTGICGKRQLREPTRSNVVQELEKKSVELYRSENARKLMKNGDSREPPHLHSGTVLRNAKSQAVQSKYLHPDPILALGILKRLSNKGQNVVRNIGFDPVLVHFWSPHQTRIYNQKIREENIPIIFDCTGRIAYETTHMDGTKSQHLFLYLGVLPCKDDQFSVVQQIAEKQNTVTIHNWLQNWLHSGAIFPKEVICDESRALLTACVWSFTNEKTLEEYANACASSTNLPSCYIRIDVAHFIRKYRNFLKAAGVRSLSKTFILAVLGALIVCTDLIEAETIIKSLLLITSSATMGEGTPTLNQAYNDMKRLITGDTSNCKEWKELIYTTSVDEEEIFSNESGSTDDEYDLDSDENQDNMDKTNISNHWQNFGRQIDEDVHKVIDKEKGDDDNPRACQNFTKYFLKDIELLPLWSNIRRHNFGYGRIPASSASVENEINKIKNLVLKKKMRIDVAVENIIDYYDGRMKIVDSSAGQNRRKRPDPVPSILSDKIKQNTLLTPDELPVTDASTMYLLDSKDKNMNNKSNGNKNNDEPTNAHTCMLCLDFVDILPECSEGKNEAFGESRVCTECFQNPRREERIAAKQNENWKNLGESPDKLNKNLKKAFYLGQNKEKMQQTLTFIKYKKLQIFRNGTDDELSNIKYQKNAQISLRNTCAFDAIFQILLSAATDYEAVENYLNQLKNDGSIFNLVLNTKRHGLRAHSYKLRADLLLKFKKETPEEGKIKCIDCTSNVGNLARFLFFETPSFKEIFKCSLGCPNRKIELPIYGIKKNILSTENFKTIVSDLVRRQRPPRCIVTNCTGIETQLALEIGDIVVFEPYDKGKLSLSSISKWFEHPEETENVFKLAGLVEYTNGKYASSDSAHYKAICLRNLNWLIYDDLKPDKHVRQKETYTLDVALLVYIKIAKPK